MNADPKRPYKAIAALVITFLGLLWANLDGSDSWSTLTTQDWVTIIVPAVLATAAVYGIRNPATGEGG